MSLYDDFDVKEKSEEVAGWSSGMKLFQSQLQIKKASTTAQVKRDLPKKATSALPPVFDLNVKKDDEVKTETKDIPIIKESLVPNFTSDLEWNFVDDAEYDPLWPNDYEKVVKELRDIREREREKEDAERQRRREERDRRRDSRFEPPDLYDDRSESSETTGMVNEPQSKVPTRSGAAIAPPPSLQEQTIIPPPPPIAPVPKSGASVAAKIMAKYGFKEGQGLGKMEQGISIALQVEKTSKRGGRIIHEKDLILPQSFGALSNYIDPQLTDIEKYDDEEINGGFVMPPPPPVSVQPPSQQQQQQVNEPSITEIMKSPSKVVLLRNMVGPGEVDPELEPEVKDECNTKYGDVIKVIIHELKSDDPSTTVPEEEAVRIFVEFKRIEAAIKAVVDLNGRFFGGRMVRAGFYPVEKFNNYQLLDM